MSNDLFEALSSLETDRGIPVNFMLEKIEKAILKACKNNYNGNDDAIININKDKGIFDVYLRKTVVDEVIDNGKEISLLNARYIDPNTAIGEKVPIRLDTKEFGRIAAQTARNIIRQGIRDGERGQMLKEFQSKLREVVTALVEKIDPKTGAASLRIGRSEAVIPKNECVGLEQIREGDHIKVLLVDVKDTEKGPKAILSRTHNNFVKKLFEQEVPEISQGVIEIKSVAREAGLRTKIAVVSKDPNVDAVGSCIGTKGARVSAILDELNGEKIDIIQYSDDPAQYICSSLAPASVNEVKIVEGETRVSRVVVPNNQFSLAIGNKGQNARLAAKLTGWKIDIKSVREAEREARRELRKSLES